MGNELTLLLQKEFTGEITPAELAEELGVVWEETAAYTFPEPLESDKYFGQILQQISRETVPAPVIPIQRNIWWRAAAAILVLVVATFFWQQWSRNQAPTLLSLTNGSNDQQMIALPDGSTVWLRRGATISYPKQFNTQKNREVLLTGNAYFEVAHQPDHPFDVMLPQGEKIEVLGTEFSVNSLETDKSSSVLVKSGSVRFLPNAQQKGLVLTKGQKAVFDRQQSKVLVSNPVSMNELAWQRGGLEFVQTPLWQVIADLQNFYHVKIELSNAATRNCRYTAPLTRQPIEQVLQSLALIYKFDIRKTGEHQFLLSNGYCK